MPIELLALNHAAQPAPAADATLRSAIVNVANYYLRMAKGKSPAEMEALIWQHDSTDGVDHGASCAAFASLTLELGAQVVGQQSWVTGGSTYPWPLREWADVRVDPNPASLGITSIRQDAAAHHRWHPLGDGYVPRPGDWVLFRGHVEVVTNYVGGVLHAVGGDSLPNFSVNAHKYGEPLHAEGVVGFVNNGALPDTAHTTPHGQTTPRSRTSPHSRTTPRNHEQVSGGQRPRARVSQGQPAAPASPTGGPPGPKLARASGGADIPGITVPAPGGGQDKQSARRTAKRGSENVATGSKPRPQARRGQAGRRTSPAAAPSGPVAAPQPETGSTAAIPGFPVAAQRRSAGPPAAPTPPYRRHQPAPAPAPRNDTAAQQAFISAVAPGAVAAQRNYGVPAAVTIAQAIEESGWGRSELATKDHNLFGIKGSGPAGSDPRPTREYEHGRWVTRVSSFRVYNDVAECIDDHGKLLASSEDYTRAMAVRQVPNAFAASLTGVYATDPAYGTKLIGLMEQHNLYRYDIAAPATVSHAAMPGGAAIPGLPRTPPAPPVATPAPTRSARATLAPGTQSDTYRRLPHGQPSAHNISVKRVLKPPSKRQTQKPASRNARNARIRTVQYQQHVPLSVRNAFIATAKVPLTREEPLYRDVAGPSGIRWELLAACDWMQCEAQSRYSPVHGEKLGTINPDGTIYRTKSAALAQCADDLVELAWSVYRIDLTTMDVLSVRDLASAFAAFRWGGLLKLHHTSAMEFPYSVAGLTAQHINMRWPRIAEANTPDKRGARFHMPFGAVPIILALNYPATV